jgi:hypothetical protein
MATTTAPNPEDAVRQYLLYLEDPDSLRDEAEIQAKTKAVLDATDPLDKLKAISVLERVANPDPTPLRDAFAKEAKAWAEENGVPLSAFQQLKVPADVLQEAGFPVPTPGRQRQRSTGVTTHRQRAAAVPTEDIKAQVLKLSGVFLLNDVAAVAGGSVATLRKAIGELITAGQVENLGPVPNYGGRGRAPLQYRVKAAA